MLSGFSQSKCLEPLHASRWNKEKFSSKHLDGNSAWVLSIVCVCVCVCVCGCRCVGVGVWVCWCVGGWIGWWRGKDWEGVEKTF